MSDAPARDIQTAIDTAAQLGVFDLFEETVRRRPGRTALTDSARRFCYSATHERVVVLSERLRARGIGAGDRIAVLSENCIEYIELHLAAARIGALVACQNWRLRDAELDHCVALVEPALLFYSERFAPAAAALCARHGACGLCWSEPGDASGAPPPRHRAAPVPVESGLLILYTSGTSGPAKAAVISQRALIARMTLLRTDLDIDADDGFIAWSPMFHMGGTEHSISTLMIGGTVFVADGFDAPYIARTLGAHRIGWLLLVPATIERVIAALDAADITPRGVKRVGAMADLLPKQQIARLSARVQAPFLNTFGATETGIAPASRGTIAPGEIPATLAKTLSSLCALRLVDEAGDDVGEGEVGEAAVRGPTLFSGYWNNEAANAKSFRGGWFRMGDLFRRRADGAVDFRGRAKYLIKSGGENIYPAEIEAVLRADPRVQDAIVVARADEQWGEVPVAVLASASADLQGLEEALSAACRERLAGYKCPKAFVFIDFAALPRSLSGKILRADVEAWLGARRSD